MAANDDWVSARGGLLPMEFPYGNFRKNYYKLTTSAVAVYLGQPMDLDTNGQAIPATVSTAGTAFMVGPVVGFADSNMNALPSAMLRVDAGPYIPASTDAYVLIADDPDQAFVMQVGTNGTTLSITTASMVKTGTFMYRSSSGSTTTGYCTAEFDPLSISTTGSGNIQIMGLIPLKNSDGSTNFVANSSGTAAGQWAKIRCRINGHRWTSDFPGNHVV